MLMLLPSASSASVLMGTVTLKVGEEYYADASYSATTTVQQGTWKKSNSNIVFVTMGQQTCKIKANRVGTATLSYKGTAAPPNSWSTYNIDRYWEITVVGDGGTGSDDDNGGDDNGNDEGTYKGEIPTDDWSKSGNYAISWYNKNQSEFTLSTNKELAGMAYLINNGYTTFEGKTIKLGADIDLSGKKWTQAQDFAGTFDGQGHSISGIYMGTDYDSQVNFGFFQKLTKASVSNLTLEGVANFDCKSNTKESSSRAGGLAGGSSGIVNNCRVSIDIYYHGDELTTGYYSEVGIGGICGNAQSVSYSSYTGSIYCTIAKPSQHINTRGLSINGIGGSSVEYSEALIPNIYINVGEYSYNLVKFIEGISLGDNIKFCRSIIDKIKIDTYIGSGGSGGPFYYISGIGRKNNITNSYSSINNVELNASGVKKFGVYYGGITYNTESNSSIACFSNSDVNFSITNDELSRGYDGSTAFTSDQMQTSAFLEELNMYSNLNMDGPIWAQSENGGYPYIKALYETTGIKGVKVNKNEDTRIFDLQGRRLQKPQKGINIINGKKVIVK